MTETEDKARADEVERTLARTTSWAIPGAAVVAAIGVGALFGVGPAILVLASGALVGVIAFLWASLRTLGGDAPLPEGLVAAGAARHAFTGVEERKRRTLRALKDLQHEHSIGKIDDADYETISARYRDQAKDILREMDEQIEPMRARAEEIARTFLARKGLGDPESAKASAGSEASERKATVAPGDKPKRVPCPKCETSNEPDASFCKKCGSRLGEEVIDATA